MSNERDEIFEYFKIIVDEEHKEVESHYKKVVFFASILSAILVATMVGVRFADDWFDLVILATLPVMSVFICRLAERVSDQFYDRFLGAVTTRAKIEQYLGFTKENHLQYDGSVSDLRYWQDEPFVQTRHLSSRNSNNKYLKDGQETSFSWYKEKLNSGYNLSAKTFFKYAKRLSIVILILILTRSLHLAVAIVSKASA